MTTRSQIIWVVAFLVVIVGLSGVFLPKSFMKPQPRALTNLTLARQDLTRVYQALRTYARSHSSVPGSLEDLDRETELFAGLTDDAKARKYNAIEFPLSEAVTTDGQNAIAAYRIRGAKFLLLEDGRVVKFPE